MVYDAECVARLGSVFVASFPEAKNCLTKWRSPPPVTCSKSVSDSSIGWLVVVFVMVLSFDRPSATTASRSVDDQDNATGFRPALFPR
jgi:hypothetical protein